MSATPIPRTLEMSLAGIREMSTILTPPEERHPVLTYVGAYNDKQVAAAIRRELLRDGQVFYVHNRVSSIDKAAKRIRDLVPEARVVVAHGQMNEDTLEQTVQGFWEREYDVLVCTTIIETGLDISNANTLIVERADSLGLSQLHQLRGRVGRSRERGYAYFLYPPEKPLTETAYDRLATISQNSDLGAGMAVAMKDLEIRGAGNVLGAEQSGHVAGVGFDLYVRLVGEAVEAYRAAADGRPITTRGARRRSASTCRSTRTSRPTTSPATGCGWRGTASSLRPTTIRRHRRGGRRTRRPLRPAAGRGPPAGLGGQAAAAVPASTDSTEIAVTGTSAEDLADVAARFQTDAAQADLPERAVPGRHRLVQLPLPRRDRRSRRGPGARRGVAAVHRRLRARAGRQGRRVRGDGGLTR